MKFTKLIALLSLLAILLTFGVACNSEGEGDETTTGAPAGSTEPPFVVTLTIIVPDENGDATKLVNEEEAQYNGLKPTNELTMFDIVEDYCSDNDLACTLDSQTGRLESIGEYTIVNGGFQWKYELNGEDLKDYDLVIANGSEIVVTLVAVD